MPGTQSGKICAGFLVETLINKAASWWVLLFFLPVVFLILSHQCQHIEELLIMALVVMEVFRKLILVMLGCQSEMS